MTEATPSLRARHVQDTRDAIIAAARALFTEQGYQHVGTEEIVQRAGLTRGAMYHHFSGKADLFLAVFQQVDHEVFDSVGEQLRVAHGADPWQDYLQGTEAFLDAATSNAAWRRIVLIDGPAVLGWERWHDRRKGPAGSFASVENWIRRSIAAGVLDDQPVEPLAHLLIAAGNEAVMYIAHSPRPRRARKEMGDSLARVLLRLRRDAGEDSGPTTG